MCLAMQKGDYIIHEHICFEKFKYSQVIVINNLMREDKYQYGSNKPGTVHYASSILTLQIHNSLFECISLLFVCVSVFVCMKNLDQQSHSTIVQYITRGRARATT